MLLSGPGAHSPLSAAGRIPTFTQETTNQLRTPFQPLLEPGVPMADVLAGGLGRRLLPKVWSGPLKRRGASASLLSCGWKTSFYFGPFENLLYTEKCVNMCFLPVSVATQYSCLERAPKKQVCPMTRTGGSRGRAFPALGWGLSQCRPGPSVTSSRTLETASLA